MGDVSTPSKVYGEMAENWALIHDLLGGTKQMRAKSELWLPRNEKESVTKYAARVSRSFLYPGFEHTVDTFTGKVFTARPTRVGEDPVDPIDITKVAASIKPLLDDIDREGNNLGVFVRDWFREGLSFGLSYVLVDFPKAPEGRTLADERTAGVRPYWVRYAASQIIGWRMQRIGGAPKLMRVRILEDVDIDNPEPWDDDAKVQQVRVLFPGGYELWRKNERQEWAIHESGATSIDFVPLVPFYAKRTGYMQALPPLMELAWKNVEHFQSSSEQRNILHVARVPILFGKMIGSADDEDDANTDVTIGASEMFMAPNAEADLKWVEHSGACIQSGKDDLETIEGHMAKLGTQILMEKPGADPTATEEAIDTSQADSNLGQMVQSIEDAANLAIHFTARWINQTDGGKVVINKQLTAMPALQQEETEPGATKTKPSTKA